MNVLFVHDHSFKYKDELFYSAGGLPKKVWQRYLNAFDQITVVGRDGGALSNNDKSFTLSSADKVSFHLLPNVANLKSLLFGNTEVNKACKQLVAKHDVVIVRVPSRLGTLFAKEAIKQNKPWAVEVVGCPWDALWNYGGIKAKLFAPYATFELKKLVKKTDFALYVTEHFLQARYPTRPGAITTFCSNVEIPAVRQEILQKRLNFISGLCNRNKIIFGLIGSYSSKYKGIDVAIKALAASKLDNWEFRVLGNGDASSYQQLAKELGVQDKVKFVGSLPSGQPVFDWLDELDIYLHPSFQEGLPRALVEAMSRGLPAIASNIAGIPELLDEKWMINAGDYQDLTNKIEKLGSDRLLQEQLAEQSFNKAKDYYKSVLDDRRTKFWQGFRNTI